jgi:hypothetical protein
VLKLLATMSLAALLSLSPALAQTPAKKCVAPDEVTSSLPLPLLFRIDDKAKLADFVKRTIETMALADNVFGTVKPEDNPIAKLTLSSVLFFARPDHFISFVVFENGCAKGSGLLTPESFKETFGEPV